MLERPDGSPQIIAAYHVRGYDQKIVETEVRLVPVDTGHVAAFWRNACAHAAKLAAVSSLSEKRDVGDELDGDDTSRMEMIVNLGTTVELGKLWILGSCPIFRPTLFSPHLAILRNDSIQESHTCSLCNQI